MANLLAISSGGELTGLGWDGVAVTSRGELTMLSIPVAAPEVLRAGEWKPIKRLRPMRQPSELVEDDDNEVLLILRTVWEALVR